ncbi:MAG: type II toxin-antitoxin system RelE/ParE family toxin [Candidatus Ozemobacteraceae bacterium]
MKVRFLPLAQQDLDNAVTWYTSQAEGLGQEFLDELDRAVRRSVSFPLSSLEIEPGLRRCLFARFPFGLVYGLDGNTLIVVAVAHLHREPRFWSDRQK